MRKLIASVALLLAAALSFAGNNGGWTNSGGALSTQAKSLSVTAVASGGGGTPTISGVSGTLTQGSTVTISGSGFSTKRNGQILFDNFADGTTGDDIAARGAWTWFDQGGSNNHTNIPEYKISAANPYIGTKHARSTVGVDQNPGGGDDFGDYFRFASDQTEIYAEFASYYHYVVAGPSASGSQIKGLRFITDGDPTTSPDPHTSFTRFNATSATTTSEVVLASSGYASESFYVNDADPSQAAIADQWNQYALYEKLSTPGSADGKRFANENGKDNMTFSSYPGKFSDPDNTGVTNRAWNGAAMMTRSSGVTALFRRLYLPFFKRDEMSVVVDIGYVYINDSPERVVCHDASTLAASTNRTGYQVQKQTSRTSTSIVIEYQQGMLAGSGNLWCTVVNSDNTFSTAYQVR